MPTDYKEIFEIEIHCWCLGLAKTKSVIDQNVLHRILKEFAPIMREAIEHLYVFDIQETARSFIKASKVRISEREIAFHILSLLPDPTSLALLQYEVLVKIVNNLEEKFDGARERFDRKWNAHDRKSKSHLKNLGEFSRLSLPKGHTR